MSNIPEFIFIVPYRDRASQLEVFLNHMKYILEGKNYEIFVSHQDDRRFFNRGAIKNLGFIYAKEKYPNDYKDITFVFNDVDSIVGDRTRTNFKTTKGIIKHIFGFIQALGGIVSIKGEDFEAVNGFPCIWNWGYEDNSLKSRLGWRAIKQGIDRNTIIDRSEFHHYNDKNIIHLSHGPEKQPRVFNRLHAWNTYSLSIKDWRDGINTITNITKTVDTDSRGNITIINYKTFNVLTQMPARAEKKVLNTLKDLRWDPNYNPEPKLHITARNFSGVFSQSKRARRRR